VHFLSQPHRHLFVIRARREVTQTDRELEFFLFQRELEQAVGYLFPGGDHMCFDPRHRFDPAMGLDFGSRSCEMIASELLLHMNLTRCGVWEDDENGAIVRAD
jgi:hypothetical protein